MHKWLVVCTALYSVNFNMSQTEYESLTPSAGHCHYYQYLNESKGTWEKNFFLNKTESKLFFHHTGIIIVER